MTTEEWIKKDIEWLEKSLAYYNSLPEDHDVLKQNINGWLIKDSFNTFLAQKTRALEDYYKRQNQ